MYAPPPLYPAPPGEEAAFRPPPPAASAPPPPGSAPTSAPPPSSAGAAARTLPATWGTRVVAAAPAGSGHMMPPPASSWPSGPAAYSSPAAAPNAAAAAYSAAHAHAAYQYHQQYAAYAHHSAAYAQHQYHVAPPQYAPAPAAPLAPPSVTLVAQEAPKQRKSPEEVLSEEHAELFKKFLKLTQERRSRSKSPAKSKKKSKETPPNVDKPIKRERDASLDSSRKDSRKTRSPKRDGSKEKRSSSARETKRSSSKKDPKDKTEKKGVKSVPKPEKKNREKDVDRKKGEDSRRKEKDPPPRGPSPERRERRSPTRTRDRRQSPAPRKSNMCNGDRRSRSRSPQRLQHRGTKRPLSPALREQDRGYSPPRKVMRPPRGPPSPIPRDEYLPIAAQKLPSNTKKDEDDGKAEGGAERDAVQYFRCSPADLYYERDKNNPRVIWATPALKELCAKFEEELLGIFPKAEAPDDEPVYSEVSEGEGCFGEAEDDFSATGPSKCAKKLVKKAKNAAAGRGDDDIDSGDESDSSVSSAKSSDLNEFLEEEERRMKTQPKTCPNALHPDLYHNEIHKRNMGPICKCNSKSRKLGIRHGVYVGEQPVKPCEKWSNNADRLFHYKVTLAPPTNFLVKSPTTINHDGHEYLFEGFSLFSHYELHSLPPCQLFRFYIHYTIDFVKQPLLETLATVHELNLFRQYVFSDLLELYDLELKIGLTYEERMKQAWVSVSDDANCDLFHFMPRFVRQLPDNGQEILSMNYVLNFLLKSWKKIMPPWDLEDKLKLSTCEWADYAESMKGMVVSDPTKRPRSIRVDQLDRDDALVYASDWLRRRRDRRRNRPNSKQDDFEPLDEDKLYPELVHFGVRPAHLTNEYHKAYREFLKARYLLVNKPKPTTQDKERLMEMERNLRKLRTQPTMKREVTVAISTKAFYETGLYCDVVQHLLFLPILVCHLRFHKSLDSLESAMNYRFKNRYLLQLALTHPSYRENYGTNPDHSRNTQTNCGIRQAEYGDREQYFQAIRKRGIVTLMKIMSQFGTDEEADSETMDNQRLEFFGDAVVEFLTSIHLFFMFPDQEEGSLATFRAALVQNSHLTHLAKILELHKYFLYSHGPDLCLELPLRRAMANCFEALLGAIYLDGGLDAADQLMASTIFKGEPDMLEVWSILPRHPLQQQEPGGDRHLIPKIPYLQKLTEFENDTGVEFNHVRLLARAFTDHSVGMTNLTLGSNQRLEFLGDTVLQLIVTEHLYLHFPSHHEGHLSLLRTTLVNNKTQAIVCDELGMARFSLSAPMRKKVVVGESPGDKPPLKMKDKADLLEAYLGALYVDKGLDLCKSFCRVCFFPRLNEFILNQDWNDPKSKLQQCCLTLRSLGESEPDIPVYEVVGCVGPTNTRIYTVAVFFRGEELARASAPSIKQAEMDAAKCALETQRDRFPHLDMLAHRDSSLRKALERVRRQKRFEKKMRSIGGRDGDDRFENNNDRNRRNQDRQPKPSQNGPEKTEETDKNPDGDAQKSQNGGPTNQNQNQNGQGQQGTGKKRRKQKKKSSVLPGSGVLAPSVDQSTPSKPPVVGKGPGTIVGRVDHTKCPMVSGPGEAPMSFVLVAPALPPKLFKKPAPRNKNNNEPGPSGTPGNDGQKK